MLRTVFIVLLRSVFVKLIVFEFKSIWTFKVNLFM